MKRALLLTFLVAIGIGAVVLMLFALKMALVFVFVAALCLGAAGLMGWLSVKRLRSTRETRPEPTGPTTT